MKTWRSLKRLAALLLIAASTSAIANDFSQCSKFFYGGKSPIIQASALQPRALCYNEFAVLHSGKTHTPIFVAQRLNREQVQAQIPRATKFFVDARLPRVERADLDDYKGSGLDRGHMAPAGDMSTLDGMAQSFSLANIVPQSPTNNRKSWANIEKATRKYVSRASGDVYVITGPVFAANAVTIGSNRVWVPSRLFKLVFDPATKKSWAYWHENADDARVERPISYAELVKRTGVEFLSGAQAQ